MNGAMVIPFNGLNVLGVNTQRAQSVNHGANSDKTTSFSVYLNDQKIESDKSTSELSTLLGRIEKLLQGEMTDEDLQEAESVLESLLAILSGEVSIHTDSVNSGSNFQSIALLTMPTKQVQGNVTLKDFGLGSQNSNQQLLGKMLMMAMNIYEKANSQTELKNKVEQVLVKLTELHSRNGEVAKALSKSVEGTRFEKVWQSIITSVKQIETTNQQTQQNDRIKQISLAMKQVIDSKSDARPIQQVNQSGLDAMPMSKVEQFTIYLERNQQSQPSGRQNQLVEQLEKAIKSSQFLQKDGALQLTLKIRPAHLGEMVVKLTQVNGEMAVKMVVSTQAVKELLESNINQLKAMFSPNQVIIEKQNDPFAQATPSQQTLKEQTPNEQNQNSRDGNREHQDSQDNNTDKTELNFKELLQGI